MEEEVGAALLASRILNKVSASKGSAQVNWDAKLRELELPSVIQGNPQPGLDLARPSGW